MVTTDVAARVATLFNGQNAQTKSIKSIKEVIPLAGEDGNPALYVVNYADNQGYAIISANNQYQPIIAYNETGNYDIHAQDGSSVLLDEHLYALQHIEALPDSVQLAFKQQWNQYFMSEEPLALGTTQTKATNESFEEKERRVSEYIESSLDEWTNLGYLIFPYYDSKEEFFTLSEIQQIDQRIQMDADNRFCGGIRSTVFIRVKREESFTNMTPLLNTTWHQEDGYAAYTPNNWLTGCGPIAVGQIMKYYEYPSLYNWDLMADNYPTSTTALFLAELGDKMNCNYGADESLTNIDDACSVLRSFGYKNCKVEDQKSYYTYWEDQLNNNWPIFMRGSNSDGKGHAWVCDGYMDSSVHDDCEVMILYRTNMDYTGNPFYLSIYRGWSNNIQMSFHMNWGWGGVNDGYWNVYQDFDFPNNRKNIIDIYPVQ